ncbi:hypothetical protein P153DRAFT_369267 [Dothidotthia symphoricarpi CBS 119687]|uniref:Uncharacterized protein n=1 Tax=Dothidotthia symphoricarpi CBS 119687 TaxID=1392245 RepID=A0A6A6A431_9PLEO|nr:uncharacterized protein P153DRAFT_369267 [Dothidotthia symphoricarpi CBS 119687]KAF2126570.1 hypothetical protein P153DRAFT_369267 [Dothidotthia symphoricarpi CBS 119687]
MNTSGLEKRRDMILSSQKPQQNISDPSAYRERSAAGHLEDRTRASAIHMPSFATMLQP